MPSFQVTRNIVSYGVLLLSEQDRECVDVSVYAQIERDPGNGYENYKYPFPEGFFGYWQALYRGFVIASGPISQKNQFLFRQSNDLIAPVGLLHCWHTATYELLNRVAAVNSLQNDNPAKLPYILTYSRLNVDSFAFHLRPGTTLQVTAYGVDAGNPCDLEVVWVDPPGPAANPDDPLAPLPPSDVPVNPKDPNGWDLPSVPYNRATDDSGKSYDPPRPEDLPSAEGNGPWKLRATIQRRSPFAPYQAEGEPVTEEQPVSGGSARAANPRVTGQFPGPGDFNWIQSIEYSFDLVNPPGPVQQSFFSVVGSPDEILSVEFVPG